MFYIIFSSWLQCLSGVEGNISVAVSTATHYGQTGRRQSKQREVTFFGIFVNSVSRDIMCWVKYVSKYAQICRRPDLILMKCEVRFGDILADLNFWNVANEIDKVSALNLTLDGNDLFSGLWHCMRLCAFLDNRLRPSYAKIGVYMLRFCWKLLSNLGQKHR